MSLLKAILDLIDGLKDIHDLTDVHDYCLSKMRDIWEKEARSGEKESKPECKENPNDLTSAQIAKMIEEDAEQDYEQFVQSYEVYWIDRLENETDEEYKKRRNIIIEEIEDEFNYEQFVQSYEGYWKKKYDESFAEFLDDLKYLYIHDDDLTYGKLRAKWEARKK